MPVFSSEGLPVRASGGDESGAGDRGGREPGGRELGGGVPGEREPELSEADLDEPADDDLYGDDGYPVRPLWARTSTLVVTVVFLFVVSGAITAWLRISDLQQRVDTLEAQALAAEDARQAAIMLAQDLATYDYRDLGGNFRHVAANATPRFAGQLRALTEELGPELQQTRAVAKATVRSAGVVRADSSKAVVAVFVDQTVTNTRNPESRTEQSRMELTLVRQSGVWRLDQAGEL
ncbi:hypothetical protein [Actinophytocola sp.]|uniref:hypothetical protein n=1 Tax=Actinophytocola sp. TaxID=1872138 RepID=UPI002ED65A37